MDDSCYKGLRAHAMHRLSRTEALNRVVNAAFAWIDAHPDQVESHHIDGSNFNLAIAGIGQFRGRVNVTEYHVCIYVDNAPPSRHIQIGDWLENQLRQVLASVPIQSSDAQ